MANDKGIGTFLVNITYNLVLSMVILCFLFQGKIGRPDKGGERFRGAISARDQKNKPTFGGVASAISAKDKFKTTSTLAA